MCKALARSPCEPWENDDDAKLGGDEKKHVWIPIAGSICKSGVPTIEDLSAAGAVPLLRVEP